MTQLVLPTHTNGARGVMFRGMVMQWIDVCAFVATDDGGRPRAVPKLALESAEDRRRFRRAARRRDERLRAAGRK